MGNIVESLYRLGESSLNEMARYKDSENPKFKVGTLVELLPNILNDFPESSHYYNNYIGKVGKIVSHNTEESNGYIVHPIEVKFEDNHVLNLYPEYVKVVK